MVRLLTTSALVAVIATGAYASTWNTAAAIRDNLSTVYSELDGNFGTSHAGAEYAELLHRIDNIGLDDFEPITLSINPETSHVERSGGGLLDDNFDLAEVIAQTDTFVNTLNTDLFYPGNMISDSDGDGEYAEDVNAGYGLASNKLNEIIKEVNAANRIITDTTKTQKEREDAIMAFNTYFDSESMKFNNAVDALENISTGLGNYSTEAQFDGFKLGGDATSSVTDDAGIIEGVKAYDSYTDYVADNGTIVATEVKVKSYTQVQQNTVKFNIPENWDIGIGSNSIGPNNIQFRTYIHGKTNKADSSPLQYADTRIKFNQNQTAEEPYQGYSIDFWDGTDWVPQELAGGVKRFTIETHANNNEALAGIVEEFKRIMDINDVQPTS